MLRNEVGMNCVLEFLGDDHMKDGVKSIIQEHLVMEFCKNLLVPFHASEIWHLKKTTNLHEGFGIPLGVKWANRWTCSCLHPSFSHSIYMRLHGCKLEARFVFCGLLTTLGAKRIIYSQSSWVAWKARGMRGTSLIMICADSKLMFSISAGSGRRLWEGETHPHAVFPIMVSWDDEWLLWSIWSMACSSGTKRDCLMLLTLSVSEADSCAESCCSPKNWLGETERHDPSFCWTLLLVMGSPGFTNGSFKPLSAAKQQCQL